MFDDDDDDDFAPVVPRPHRPSKPKRKSRKRSAGRSGAATAKRPRRSVPVTPVVAPPAAARRAAAEPVAAKPAATTPAAAAPTAPAVIVLSDDEETAAEPEQPAAEPERSEPARPEPEPGSPPAAAGGASLSQELSVSQNVCADLLEEFSEPQSPVSEPEDAASREEPAFDVDAGEPAFEAEEPAADVPVTLEAASWLEPEPAESGAAAPAADAPEPIDLDDPVSRWLSGLGLAKYAPAFASAEIDMETLPFLGSEDLFHLGVERLGPRRKILHAIVANQTGAGNGADEGAHPWAQPQPQQPAQQQEQQENAPPKPAGPVFSIFTAAGAAAAGAASVAPPAKKRPPLTLASLARSRRGGKGGLSGRGGKGGSGRAGSRTGAGGRARSGGGTFFRGRARQRLPCPAWRIVEGTKFVVDEFKATPPPGCAGFFLSHFHADHYGGLTKSFSDGLIYCSQATANLVISRLKVSAARLRPLPLGVPTEVAGVQVTLVDANHCPGSVVFLFELPDGRKHLHTGDFRFAPEMLDAHNGLLRRAANVSAFQPSGSSSAPAGFTTCYLDTTYCDPQYTFPSQRAAIDFCVSAARTEGFNAQSTLFLVGSYTIGKEKVMLALSKAMDRPIYVEPAKHAVLSQLEMPAEDFARFTTDASATNLAAAKLHELTLGALRVRKRKPHGGRVYTTIVAFKPTGWAMGRGGKRAPKKQKQQRLAGAGPVSTLGMAEGVTKQQRDGCLIFSVPYSEHSSFTELRAFIDATRPRRIVPTVNNSNPQKVNEMLRLLRPSPLPSQPAPAASEPLAATASAARTRTPLEMALAEAAAEAAEPDGAELADSAAGSQPPTGSQQSTEDWDLGADTLFDDNGEPASADDGAAAAGAAAALGGGSTEPAPPPTLAPAKAVSFKARTSRFGQ